MTKERILQVISFKGIKRSDFLKKTGIKRGFLDTDKLNQAVSDEHFTKIIAIFPDISLEWLLTGKGEMLKKKPTETVAEARDTVVSGEEINVYKEIMTENRELREKIGELREKIGELKNENKHLSEENARLRAEREKGTD